MAKTAKGVALDAFSNHRAIWFRLCGVLAMVAVIFASLMLPAEWERMRTGHWFVEHFLGYFVASSIILLGWPQPLLVAGFLAVAAVILEALQSLSPSHAANLNSVIGGATGALAAALIAKVIIGAEAGGPCRASGNPSSLARLAQFMTLSASSAIVFACL